MTKRQSPTMTKMYTLSSQDKFVLQLSGGTLDPTKSTGVGPRQNQMLKRWILNWAYISKTGLMARNVQLAMFATMANLQALRTEMTRRLEKMKTAILGIVVR